MKKHKLSDIFSAFSRLRYCSDIIEFSVEMELCDRKVYTIKDREESADVEKAVREEHTEKCAKCKTFRGKVLGFGKKGCCKILDERS